MIRPSIRQQRDRPLWLVTFADLVALLLAFFVMMFATQRVERLPWEALISSLSRSLNPDQSVQKSEPSSRRNVRRLSAKRAVDLGYLEKLLRDQAAVEVPLDAIRIRRREDRLTIELPADSLFATGSDELTRGARDVIFSLAGIFRNIGNRIDVHGHTDPRPVRGTVHRSNWELSIARAFTVADALRQAGYHRRIAALGFADTRFDEVSRAGALSRAYAAARRVDIVVRPTRRAAP
jgi:chemotaxis protein MotB